MLAGDLPPRLGAGGHLLGACSAAGEESGNVVAAGGHGWIAVAQVEAPADAVGGVGQRAVDGALLQQDYAADTDLAQDLFTRWKLMVV